MAENQNIEWKETWRDEYLKWVCGFANAQGGKIYIGMNDDGTVTGIENSRRLMEDIPNKIQTTMGIVADVNLLSNDGREYIEIVVSPSSYPVNYKGEFHYRSGSTKQILRGIALNEFLASKTGIRWEDVIVSGVTADDLDRESFDIFRREALRSGRMTRADLTMTNAELLDSLELVTELGLKRAAVMLFHQRPEKWVSGCYTKIGKFGVGSDLQYQDEVHGSLFVQADRIVELIYLKYLKAPITYDGMTRVETYPYAKDAVREAVYNALIHSCWSSGVPIQIRIEDDAMYISNDCVFPSDWTAESLLERHRSRPYNPCIAKAFFRAGYVEAWGRGVQKIYETCRAYGTEPPEYTVHSQDIMVKLPALKITQTGAETTQSPTQTKGETTQTGTYDVENGTHDGTHGVENGTHEAKNIDQKIEFGTHDAENGTHGGTHGTENGTHDVQELTEYANRILNMVREDGHVTRNQMADSLSLSPRTVQRILNQMPMLVYVGSGNNGHWEIKGEK